jgi:hypothetical protein
VVREVFRKADVFIRIKIICKIRCTLITPGATQGNLRLTNENTACKIQMNLRLTNEIIACKVQVNLRLTNENAACKVQVHLTLTNENIACTY